MNGRSAATHCARSGVGNAMRRPSTGATGAADRQRPRTGRRAIGERAAAQTGMGVEQRVGKLPEREARSVGAGSASPGETRARPRRAGSRGRRRASAPRVRLRRRASRPSTDVRAPRPRPPDAGRAARSGRGLAANSIAMTPSRARRQAKRDSDARSSAPSGERSSVPPGARAAMVANGLPAEVFSVQRSAPASSRVCASQDQRPSADECPGSAPLWRRRPRPRRRSARAGRSAGSKEGRRAAGSRPDSGA